MKKVFVVLALLFACGLAQATPILPWRQQMHQRLLNLENKGGPQAQPAPPQIIVLPPTYQQLPIPGNPKQQLPIQGDPKQQLPIPGDPKQQLPIPGDPKQPLPIQGPPKLELPMPGPPIQQIPIAPPGADQPQRLTIFYVRALYRPN
jgi:hypothetical protein